MVLISRASIKKMPKNVKKISNIKNINRYKKRCQLPPPEGGGLLVIARATVD